MVVGHNSFILNQLMIKMKKIINNLKSIFNINPTNKEVINCNYSNNYYGDQYCQTSTK